LASRQAFQVPEQHPIIADPVSLDEGADMIDPARQGLLNFGGRQFVFVRKPENPPPHRFIAFNLSGLVPLLI
jgi:hypothetical protein